MRRIAHSVGVPLGESNYNSFQLSVTQRPTRGLNAQISYNLSRANGNVDSNFDETWSSGTLQDQYNLKDEVDIPQPFDQRHIFKGYVGCELPYGRGRQFLSDSNSVLDAFLGGWTLTTIFRYASGGPLGVRPDVSYPGWEGAVYANYDPSVPLNVNFNSKAFNPGKLEDAGNRYSISGEPRVIQFGLRLTF